MSISNGITLTGVTCGHTWHCLAALLVNTRFRVQHGPSKGIGLIDPGTRFAQVVFLVTDSMSRSRSVGCASPCLFPLAREPNLEDLGVWGQENNFVVPVLYKEGLAREKTRFCTAKYKGASSLPGVQSVLNQVLWAFEKFDLWGFCGFVQCLHSEISRIILDGASLTSWRACGEICEYYSGNFFILSQFHLHSAISQVSCKV